MTPLGAEGDHARVPEDAQLLRHRWLRPAGPIDQVADGPLPIPQRIENLSSRAIGQKLEDIGHAQCMSKRIYVYSCMR